MGRSHLKRSAVFKGETILVKHVHRVHYSATIIKNCGINIVSINQQLAQHLTRHVDCILHEVVANNTEVVN